MFYLTHLQTHIIYYYFSLYVLILLFHTLVLTQCSVS